MLKKITVVIFAVAISLSLLTTVYAKEFFGCKAVASWGVFSGISCECKGPGSCSSTNYPVYDEYGNFSIRYVITCDCQESESTHDYRDVTMP